MNVLVFDIQTIPDIDGARRLYDLHGLSDDDVAKAIFHKRRQQANTETLPLHLHKIVTISAVMVNGEDFKVWSLGDENSTEEDLLQRFFSGLQRFMPTLVSWNGRGFELPVIHYRSLLYPVNAKCYWDLSDVDCNYQSRFDDRHTDLMDVLSCYQAQSTVALDEMATLCGFPGTMCLANKKVWDSWQSGKIGLLRAGSQCNVLNTYLVYLNWQRNRGQISPELYSSQCLLVRKNLQQSSSPQLLEFEKKWLDL